MAAECLTTPGICQHSLTIRGGAVRHVIDDLLLQAAPSVYESTPGGAYSLESKIETFERGQDRVASSLDASQELTSQAHWSAYRDRLLSL